MQGSLACSSRHVASGEGQEGAMHQAGVCVGMLRPAHTHLALATSRVTTMVGASGLVTPTSGVGTAPHGAATTRLRLSWVVAGVVVEAGTSPVPHRATGLHPRGPSSAGRPSLGSSARTAHLPAALLLQEGTMVRHLRRAALLQPAPPAPTSPSGPAMVPVGLPMAAAAAGMMEPALGASRADGLRAAAAVHATRVAAAVHAMRAAAALATKEAAAHAMRAAVGATRAPAVAAMTAAALPLMRALVPMPATGRAMVRPAAAAPAEAIGARQLLPAATAAAATATAAMALAAAVLPMAAAATQAVMALEGQLLAPVATFQVAISSSRGTALARSSTAASSTAAATSSSRGQAGTEATSSTAPLRSQAVDMVGAAGVVLGAGSAAHLRAVTGVAGSTQLLLWPQPVGHQAALG
jgi:hypothetical protein